MRLWKVPESRWLPSSCPETPSSGDELWTNVEGRWSFASRLCAACPAAAVSQAPLRKPTYTCKIKCVIFISVKMNRCWTDATMGSRGCCDCFWCTLVFPIWYVVGSRPIFFPSSAAMSSLQAVALLGNRTLNWSTNSCGYKKNPRKMKTWWEDFYFSFVWRKWAKKPCTTCSYLWLLFIVHLYVLVHFVMWNLQINICKYYMTVPQQKTNYFTWNVYLAP